MPPAISRGHVGATLWLKALWPLGAILAYFGIVILFCNPLYDTPLYDDWAYADNVRRFLDRGELRFIWTQVPFFGQLLGGALFAKLFGFSFATLHLWGLFTGVVGAFSIYALGRAYGRSRSTSLLVALAVVSSPAYLHFCFTFMTDVPATAFFLLALVIFAHGERAAASTPRRSALWYLLAGVLLAFSVTVRDFTAFFLLPLAFEVWHDRRSHPRRFAFAAAVLLSIMSYGIMIGFVEMPYRAAKLSRNVVGHESLRFSYVIISYVGLLLLPVLAAFLPDFFRKELKGRPRRALAWWGCLILMVGLAIYQYCWTVKHDPTSKDELMPYPPGFISIHGPYQACPIPGFRAVVIQYPMRIVLTALGAGGGAILLYTALVLARQTVVLGRRERRVRRIAWGSGMLLAAAGAAAWIVPPRLSLRPWLVDQIRSLGHVLLIIALVAAALVILMRRRRPASPQYRDIGLPLLTAGSIAVGVAAFVYYAFSAKFYIRYALAIVPGALCATLAVFRRLRLNRAVLVAVTIVSTVFSVIVTRDQIEFSDARWRAGRWLLSEGVLPDQIVGGMEFDYWFNQFRGPQPSPRHVLIGDAWLEPLYLLTLDTFRDSCRPVRGPGKGVLYWGCEYRKVAGPKVPLFPYRSLLGGRQRRVEIWRRLDAPVPGRIG
ncbi:MAG: glycosyltransferase family 39 protein [Candidatus Eisenbacteria bacterium]|nr:glycosyltransferase family 39 protein [Candidatus Eisenbacteria bacterium]